MWVLFELRKLKPQVVNRLSKVARMVRSRPGLVLWGPGAYSSEFWLRCGPVSR